MRFLLLPPEFFRLSRKPTHLPDSRFPAIWSAPPELKNFALSFTKNPLDAIFIITFTRGGGFRDPKIPMTRGAERYARGAYSVFPRVSSTDGSCLLSFPLRIGPVDLRIHDPRLSSTPGSVFPCPRTVHVRCSFPIPRAPRKNSWNFCSCPRRGMKKHIHQGDDLKKCHRFTRSSTENRLPPSRA